MVYLSNCLIFSSIIKKLYDVHTSGSEKKELSFLLEIIGIEYTAVVKSYSQKKGIPINFDRL